MSKVSVMAALTTTDMPRPSRGGRPRDPSRDGVIRAAILRLLADVGYGALTMDAVASEAGVGKATIYRRWKSKEALFVEAVQQMARTPEIPDTGTVRGDLEAVVAATIGRMARDAFRIIPRLLADAADDPRLLAAMQEALLTPRRAALGEILRRGVARGELRADLDVELVTQIVFGTTVASVLMSGGDTSALPELPLRVFDTLAAGIAR
jgi:AcrR family transcriptional regulator